ncbi:MBL fold metallo-hydrolase [Pseudodesulfovibrio sp.]|uniref:MBL fold metallo-hydrolase n=1 Tax=unclassified Pseudodesulfovibrio TaxID=2661612 RepID=UPI003AFF7335
MQLTFLVDNCSLIGTTYLAEPALSILILDEGHRILFDAGYSDAFLKNARQMNKDLLHLDWIVLSHGHFDHTWGLDVLIRHYFEAARSDVRASRPRLLAHPEAFVTKRKGATPEIGMLLAEDKLNTQFELALSREPVHLTDRLVALGQIERTLDFETPPPLGERMEPDGPVPDHMPDDTALAYVSDSGLVIISGCAHAGICNTVEHAKRVTGVDNVRAVLGGFHLLNETPARLDPTTDYLASLNLEALYPCHCTDLGAKIALARKCSVGQIGSGVTLEF